MQLYFSRDVTVKNRYRKNSLTDSTSAARGCPLQQWRQIEIMVTVADRHGNCALSIHQRENAYEDFKVRQWTG